MDFMNFMNQINANCGTGCGTALNCENTHCTHNHGLGLLPFLLLSGLGQNMNQRAGGNMVCYPNTQCSQQYMMPTTFSGDPGLKYKTKKVRQAYMEVPVATYQVPYCTQPAPTTMNVVPVPNGNGGFDLGTLLLLLCLGSKNNNCCNIPPRPQPRAYGNCSSTEL